MIHAPGGRVIILSSNGSRFPRFPAALGLVLATLAAGCGTQPAEQPPQPSEPARVDTAAPAWVKAPPHTSEQAPETASDQPAAAPDVSRAAPEQFDRALAIHRDTLLASADRTLPDSEAGYYLDTLEARLIQLLRDSGVKYRRRDNRFEMQLAAGSSFASNTAQLTAAAVEQLGPVVDVLVEYDRTRILIYGHTDDTGDPAYNRELSARRAAAVSRLLVDAGVDPRRILIAGFGEERPVADNGTDDGRAQNRRVELVVEALVRQGRL